MYVLKDNAAMDSSPKFKHPFWRDKSDCQNKNVVSKTRGGFADVRNLYVSLCCSKQAACCAELWLNFMGRSLMSLARSSAGWTETGGG